ncbi:C25F9.2 protein [Aphelenchoides avenae]|nr:C25F9.2 protein [Aphelenchus avenae]
MDGPPGSMLDYNDTDSVICEFLPTPFLPNGGNPLREGHFLGEMTDEHLNEEILEFSSGGNKQYVLKLRNEKTGEIVHKLKIRGITLNEVNSNLLPYERFRGMTLEAPNVEAVKLPTQLIMRDKKFNVFTLNSSKGYIPIFRKGNVDLRCERRTIFPPGYVFTPEELA